MLVTPGATAYLFTDRFDRMTLLAITSSVLASLLGVIISYWSDSSTAGCIVLVQTGLFLLAFLFARATASFANTLKLAPDMGQPAKVWAVNQLRRRQQQTSRQPVVALELIGCELVTCRRDEQLIEVFAAKAAGGDFAARQFHAGQLLTTGWIPSGDSRTIMQRNPEHALGVNGHAIGHTAPLRWNLHANRAFVSGISLRIQGESQHLLCWRVNEIKKRRSALQANPLEMVTSERIRRDWRLLSRRQSAPAPVTNS